MATVSNIDNGVPSTTLTADTVDTLQVLGSTARARVVVVTNLHASGVIAVNYGPTSGTVDDPTKTGDFHQVGPGQSLPFEIGGAAYTFKVISGTACPYLLNVQTILA